MILLVQEWYKMSISAQILATVPEKVIQAAASLKLLVLDVDGVLTDGQLFFSEEGDDFIFIIFQVHKRGGDYSRIYLGWVY